MNGSDQIDSLRAAGFSSDDIAQHVTDTHQQLLDAGFSQADADAYFGKKEPNMAGTRRYFDGVVTALKAGAKALTTQPQVLDAAKRVAMATIGSDNPNAKPGEEVEAKTFEDYVRAGFQQSVTGLSERGKLPDTVMGPDAPWYGRLTSNIASLTGDAPSMAAGAAVGSLAGPYGTAGGAFALPAALRKELILNIQNGSVKDSRDFLDRAMAVTWEGAKGFLTGVATRGAGEASKLLPISQPLMKTGAQVSSELTALVSVQKALEGELPQPGDFIDAAVLLVGAKATGAAVGKLHDIYARTGKTPGVVLSDMERDPTIKQDILATNKDLPDAYAPLDEASGALEVRPRTVEGTLVDRPAWEDPDYHGPQGADEPMEHWQERIKKSLLELIKEIPVNSGLAHDMRSSARSQSPPQIGILATNKDLPAAPTLKDKAVSGYEKFYTDYVNDLNPIFDVSKKLAEGEKVPVIDDPAKLAQLTRGSFGRADHFIEYSPFKFDTYKNVGKSMKESLAPVFELEDAAPSESERAVLAKLDTGELSKADKVGGVDRLEAYMLAKHALEAKTETGIPLDAARQSVKEGKDRFDSVAKDITAFREHTLQYMVDGGLVSAGKADAFREAYKSYVPLYRLFDGEVGGRISGKSDLRSPLLGRQGSERQIQHPLDSIVKDTYTFIALTERNAARLALADLADKSPVGSDYVKKVPTPSKPITVTEPEVAAFLKTHDLDPSKAEAFSIFRPDYGLKDDQIAVFRDGKREIYQVDPEVKKAFEGADRPTANLLVNLLSKPASWLRAGAVLSPDFIGRNPVRDQWSAFIFSGAGYRPFMDMATGLGSVFKKDASYQAWLKSGGANSALVSVDREYIENKVLKLAKDTGLLDSAINVVKSPFEGLRVVSELMENATRVGEFKRNASSESDKAAMLEGGFNSREVTLDFARIGAKMQAVNSITAFSNAGIQGIDRAARAFKENPVGTSAKIAAAITLPSVLLWWANHDDPRYKDLPQWQKDLFWIVMTKDHVYRIPKPFELGILFGTAPERILDKFVGDNPHAFDHLASTVTQAFVPNYMPTATVPFFEQWANKSFLSGNPVVPARLEKLLPEYQYTEYTTEATKAIGHAIGTLPGLHDSDAASPAIIDNYVRGWSGGLGQYVLKAADAGLRKMGVLPDPVKPADTLADVLFVKAFVVRYPSANAQPITDFHERYAANKRVADTVQALAQDGNADALMREMKLQPGAMMKLDDISTGLSEASKTVRLIYKMPDLSPDEKRQLIDTIYYQMIEMAKSGNSAMDEVEKVLPRQ
jgi:hypothetical protein